MLREDARMMSHTQKTGAISSTSNTQPEECKGMRSPAQSITTLPSSFLKPTPAPCMNPSHLDLVTCITVSLLRSPISRLRSPIGGLLRRRNVPLLRSNGFLVIVDRTSGVVIGMRSGGIVGHALLGCLCHHLRQHSPELYTPVEWPGKGGKAGEWDGRKQGRKKHTG